FGSGARATASTYTQRRGVTVIPLRSQRYGARPRLYTPRRDGQPRSSVVRVNRRGRARRTGRPGTGGRDGCTLAVVVDSRPHFQSVLLLHDPVERDRGRDLPDAGGESRPALEQGGRQRRLDRVPVHGARGRPACPTRGCAGPPRPTRRQPRPESQPD